MVKDALVIADIKIWHWRISDKMRSLTSDGSSWSFAGSGRNGFAFRRADLQVGTGHLLEISQRKLDSKDANK